MKSSINRYALVVIFSAATACRISKDIPPVQPLLPASFSATSTDTVSIATIPWKTYFTSPDLQALIDTAIVNNYDMQVALKNIEQSQLLLKQTKWNNVPELGFNITANSSRPSDNSLTGLSLSAFGVATSHIEDYSANFGISWEADIWGKIRNKSKSALAAYLQTAEVKKNDTNKHCKKCSTRLLQLSYAEYPIGHCAKKCIVKRQHHHHYKTPV